MVFLPGVPRVVKEQAYQHHNAVPGKQCHKISILAIGVLKKRTEIALCARCFP